MESRAKLTLSQHVINFQISLEISLYPSMLEYTINSFLKDCPRRITSLPLITLLLASHPFFWVIFQCSSPKLMLFTCHRKKTTFWGKLKTNSYIYYSTNCNTIQIWSWCSRYLSSVGNRYPAIYVASYVLNVTTVPFETKFTRTFLLQGFRLFCYQFVE